MRYIYYWEHTEYYVPKQQKKPYQPGGCALAIFWIVIGLLVIGLISK